MIDLNIRDGSPESAVKLPIEGRTMKNALELLKELCHLEFCEMQAEKAAALLSENVCVLGTSDARVIRNRAQALAYLRQELTQMDRPSHIAFYDEYLVKTGGDSSTACARMHLENDGVAVHLRVSASAGAEHGEGRLMSVHLSVADTARASNESYPVAVKHKLLHDITNAQDNAHLVETLLSSVNGGVATFRVENGRFYPEFVSSGVAKLLGMTVAEYKAMYQGNIRASVYDADVDMLRTTVEMALGQNKSTSLTYRSPNKNGGFVWVNGVFSPLGFTEDNKPLIQAIFTPASQQFSSQTSILDSTSTGVYIIDRNSYELYYANRAGFETLKIEPCSYLGKTCYEVMHRRSSPCEFCVLHSTAESKQATEVYTPDIGCTHLVHAEKTDWNGKEAIIEYLTDITELKQAEEQLRRSNELIEAASAYAGMWVWVYDIDRSTAHCYRKLREDFGLPEYIENYPESGLVFNSFSDDYAVAYRAAIVRIKNGSESEELEYRGIYNGAEHWLQVRINLIPEVGGVHRHAICTAQSIDAKKRLESRIELERHKPFSNQEALLGYVVSNLSKNIIVSHKRIPRNSPTAIDGVTIPESAANSAPFYADEKDRAVFLEAHQVDALLDYYERGGTSKTYEFRRRLADGSIHWVRNTMDVLRDPVSGDIMLYEYCHDIDKEKKDHLAIDSLVDDEIDYIIIVDSVTELCHLVRSKANPVEAQAWDGKIFSTTLTALIESAVHPEDRTKCMTFAKISKLRELLELKNEIVVTYRSKPGEGRTVFKVMRAFYLDDTHTDIVLARRDVTNIYETEEKQRQLLQKTADAANRANRAKSEFMSNMSHDMRTPLNGILGLTYLMQEQQDIDEIKMQAVRLRESGEYLLRLINDVLDVERIETGHLTLDPKPCDEEQVFRSIIEMVTPLLEEKHIAFHFEKIDIEWQYMLLDEQRVKQIFINLLSNAIKFTPEGGRIDFVMQLVSQTDDMIRDKFIVRDTGIGMSRDFLPHIFESFRQENRGSVDANNGTGLGMPIVKQLVELMGGSVTVESVENQGTEVTVFINFPLAPRPDKAADQPQTATMLSGRRILLCEDQPLNAKVTKKLLEQQNCAIEWAENGQLGLEKFVASPKGYYSAILMDIRMPVMDGIAAAKAIRALPREDAASIPIIALSANAYDGDIQQAKAAGINAHLAKPYKPADLFETLAKQINVSKENDTDE